jgi:hypothetical protein
MEEFNTEFTECFETPSQLRGIISQTSEQTEECDRTLTYMVRYGCGGGCTQSIFSRADDIEDTYMSKCEDEVEAFKNVEEYFAKYEETECECAGAGAGAGAGVGAVNEEVVDNGIKKDNADDDDDDDYDEFEKL